MSCTIGSSIFTKQYPHSKGPAAGPDIDVQGILHWEWRDFGKARPSDTQLTRKPPV